jgi:hypothetical protein
MRNAVSRSSRACRVHSLGHAATVTIQAPGTRPLSKTRMARWRTGLALGVRGADQQFKTACGGTVRLRPRAEMAIPPPR